MNITFETINGASLAHAQGRLDFAASAGFQSQLEKAVAECTRCLVLDGSMVEYVSSAGLRTFLVIARAAKAKGVGFIVCALQPSVSDVFSISGFGRLITVEPTVEAALASPAAQPV